MPRPSLRRAAAASVSLVALLAGVLVAVAPATAATAPVTRLSLNARATASSTLSAAYAPAKADDGRLATKWASAHTTSKQWIKLDLGRSSAVSRIELRWSGPHATSMRIQTSPDNATWTQVYRSTTAKGGSQSIAVSGTGRYVRVVGDKASSSHGYQLSEFQVYGSAVAATTPPSTPPTTPATTGVHVTGSTGAWQLTVDGEPFTVRGVTYDPKVNAPATYLPDVASMGANTVRDWGTDVSSTTSGFLDQASRNHLHVIAGLWIDYGQDWTSNADYQASMLQTITKTVTAYRDSDAVLMWDVGNEVMLNLPNDTQRRAYAGFIEKAATAIHAIDPAHPVTSTDALTSYWPIYEKYSPSLDVFGLNTYRGIAGAQAEWRAGSYTRPYVVTEAGPMGWWEVPTDANGQPVQPSDAQSAKDYTAAWNAITAAKGIALGGTLFHYSNEKDIQASWFGIRPGDLKRASYYALAAAWGGSVGSNRPPVVSSMKTSATSVAASGTFVVAAPATDPDGDPLTYSVTRTSMPLGQYAVASAAHVTRLSAGRYEVLAPQAAGVYRFYVSVSDGKGNVDIESRTVRVG